MIFFLWYLYINKRITFATPLLFFTNVNSADDKRCALVDKILLNNVCVFILKTYHFILKQLLHISPRVINRAISAMIILVNRAAHKNEDIQQTNHDHIRLLPNEQTKPNDTNWFKIQTVCQNSKLSKFTRPILQMSNQFFPYFLQYFSK